MTGLLIGFYFREKTVYIGINTMEAIGMPKYVHCYVNEDDKCIFLEGCEKDLDAAKVRCQRNRVTGNLYYTLSAPGFLKWMADIMGIKPDSESVRMSGRYIEGENIVCYDLTDYDVIPYNEQKGWRE